MSILEIYKQKNRDKKWFFDYSSLSKGKFGRMFEYTTTNFRTQNTFIEDFEKFLEVENKPRNEWPKQKHHQQEIHKQYVLPMIQSKLFKKDENDLYNRTQKGFVYGDFIKLNMGSEERWLINFTFLFNGYFCSRKNYILNRVVNDLLGRLLTVDGISRELLVVEAKKLLKLTKNSFSKIIRTDFFYFHSFFNDSDFLTNYLRATKQEKEELAKYIEKNRESKNFQCCISEKYKSNGNFNQTTLMDETKTFLFTLLFAELQGKNLENIYRLFIEKFQQNIASINEKYALEYFLNNKDVFDPVFEEVLEIEDIEEESKETRAIEKPQKDIPEIYIDDTSKIGKRKVKEIFSIRKRQAKIEGKYKCALEVTNNCKSIYFTAKTNNKNYVELHHLIPREFGNDFSYSIEVLANYVILCPRCHRQIHFAVDRERKHLINTLFYERDKRLKIVGLSLDLKKIYEYYKIN